MSFVGSPVRRSLQDRPLIVVCNASETQTYELRGAHQSRFDEKGDFVLHLSPRDETALPFGRESSQSLRWLSIRDVGRDIAPKYFFIAPCSQEVLICPLDQTGPSLIERNSNRIIGSPQFSVTYIFVLLSLDPSIRKQHHLVSVVRSWMESKVYWRELFDEG